MRYRQFKIVERDTIDKERLKKIDRITRKLQSDPDLVDEIFKQISTKAKDIEGNFINRFVSMLDPEKTTPEKDQTFADFLKKYAEIIYENLKNSSLLSHYIFMSFDPKIINELNK